MKKLLLLVFAISALCFSACQPEVEVPQKGSIYGVVSHSKTGEPIQGVSVTLSPSNFTTVTGYDGHYEYVEVEVGQYKIYCQASGLEPNYQPVTVKAGLASTADIILTPKQTTTSFEISTTTLNFGTNHTELALEITNTSTAGDINWEISGVSVPWLTFVPSYGTLAMGKTDVIIAQIDRDQITENHITYIKLNAAGSSRSITVKVDCASTGTGGSEEEENQNPPAGSHSFTLSETELDFGTSETDKIFYIENTGTAGDMTWSVKDLTEDWLTVHPESGTLSMNATDVVLVEVDRTKLTTDATAYLKIVSEGSTKSITIKVKKEQTSGSEEDDNTNPPAGSHSFTLSETELDFGTSETEKIFYIENIGTAGNMTWSVENVTANWLSVNPSSGTLSMNATDVIFVSVDRSKVTADATTYLKITSEGSSKSVTVKVQKEQTSGGGDNGSTGGGTTTEDYSSATVQTCDYRIGVKIASCKRNGSSVLFTYTITNNNFGDCDNFRIVGPARMGSRTTIYDSEGNQYEYNIMMTFGSKKNGSSHILNGPLLEGVPYKCSFDIPNVPSTATHMSFKIEVEAYAHINDCGSDFINFLNVPIY